jgi:hypothetical protein
MTEIRVTAMLDTIQSCGDVQFSILQGTLLCGQLSNELLKIEGLLH